MAQVNIHNHHTIEKLTNDPAYRENFLANTEKFLNTVGVPLDKKTLSDVIEKQLESIALLPAGVARAQTIAIITIM